MWQHETIVSNREDDEIHDEIHDAEHSQRSNEERSRNEIRLSWVLLLGQIVFEVLSSVSVSEPLKFY